MSVATARPGSGRRNVLGRLAGPAAAGAAACAGFAVAPLPPVPEYVTSGSAGLAGLSLVAGVAAYRSARRAELVSSLQVGLSLLIGSPAQTRVKPGRWRGGFVGAPHRLTVWFDSQARTHDPKWSPQLVEICKARTGLAYTVKGSTTADRGSRWSPRPVTVRSRRRRSSVGRSGPSVSCWARR